MTTVPLDGADGAAPAAPRVARWQLPRGRPAAAHARRTIQAALRRWGLGPVADALAQQMAALAQDLSTRGAGPVSLRLELRPAARLLLGEIQDGTADRPGPDDRCTDGDIGRRIIALTYGARRTCDGNATWYTHTFTWCRPRTSAPDR
ncbi:hypothetical protein [Spirillospora albida]|uniref:hypothetical protein n=1 Tax=Spirillospora albida TaxID=58123 RepID=UPI0012F838FE|nr:hypothetical protein [Spirillospora albida]